MQSIFKQTAKVINKSNHLTAFTGAGISVESGIPPFRGENGIWNKFNPEIFDLNFFISHPKEVWKFVYEVFYKTIYNTTPNKAHYALAKLEEKQILKAIITQNIDNLHFKAGSKNVYEFHGNTRQANCLDCGKKYEIKDINLSVLPPKCTCNGILKPDFVFFSEPIPADVLTKSFKEAEIADVFLIIGTTGVIYPAAQIPILAKQNGSKIIEINIEPSEYTNTITDIFIQAKASIAMEQILQLLENC